MNLFGTIVSPVILYGVAALALSARRPSYLSAAISRIQLLKSTHQITRMLCTAVEGTASSSHPQVINTPHPGRGSSGRRCKRPRSVLPISANNGSES